MPNEAINATLDLEGLLVLGVSVHDGVAEVVVESQAPAARCPRCLSPTSVIKGRPISLVRDLPISGHQVVLLWRKKRWICRPCSSSFTESHPEIPTRARMTTRFRRQLAEEAAFCGNFTGTAARHRVSYHSVAVAHKQGAELIAASKVAMAPRAIALDECSFGAGHDYVTVVSDLGRSCTYDVVKGRHEQELRAWMRTLPQSFFDSVEVVVADLWPPYRRIVKAFLPDAVVVADKFHVIRLGCDAIDRVRKRVQGSKRSRGDRTHVWVVRKILARDPATLRPEQAAALRTALDAEPELATAHRLLQLLRRIYACTDRHSASHALDLFVDTTESTELGEFRYAARALRRRREQILNYFDTRVTNALAEGTNTKIQLVKRQAFGLRSFPSFRHRILVQCGRPKPTEPRLIA